MSFILDALKKSENERQRQTKPGLFEARVASPRARFPIWAVSIGALLGVNLLILVWLMTRPDAPAPAAPTPGTAAPMAAPAASASAGVTAQPATANAVPAERFNPPLVVDPSLDGGIPGPGPAGPASAGPTSAGQAPPFNANDYIPAQAGTGRSTVPVAGSSSASNGLPTREDLVGRGQQIPEANLSLHVFDAVPAKRFVFVNGQRGGEGETLPNGLRIEEIIGDGAILSWNGTRFLVPIQ